MSTKPLRKFVVLGYLDRLTEALADEIHQAAVDGTLGGGA